LTGHQKIQLGKGISGTVKAFHRHLAHYEIVPVAVSATRFLPATDLEVAAVVYDTDDFANEQDVPRSVGILRADNGPEGDLTFNVAGLNAAGEAYDEDVVVAKNNSGRTAGAFARVLAITAPAHGGTAGTFTAGNQSIFGLPVALQLNSVLAIYNGEDIADIVVRTEVDIDPNEVAMNTFDVTGKATMDGTNPIGVLFFWPTDSVE